MGKLAYGYIYDARGGCYTCHGDEAHWWSKNAHGLAARHHKATGHPTWVAVESSYYYGDRDKTDPAQIEIPDDGKE